MATHASVTLAWDDPGNTSITGYVILRRDIVRQSPGVFTTVEADTGTAATTYTDGGVEPKTRYAYRIKAVNAHGTSSRSGYVNVETPAAPAAGNDREPQGNEQVLGPTDSEAYFRSPASGPRRSPILRQGEGT